MKKYLVKKGDSLQSISEMFQVKDTQTLQIYHNTHCPLEDLIGNQIIVGKNILIPEEPAYLKHAETSKAAQENQSGKVSDSTQNTNSNQSDSNSQTQSNSGASGKSSSNEHAGKYFVVQKGQCQCDQGFKFPKFKVTSHQKNYWNDESGNADFLAVTETDLQLDPPAEPFGKCKLKPSSSGYLPCTYAPAGKWTKTYDKVKIMGNNCVTEVSELMCTTGGKITIFKHGQQSQASGGQVSKANSQEQQTYNPIMDFEEFQYEMDSQNNYAH